MTHSAKTIFDRFATRRTTLAKMGALALTAGLPSALAAQVDDLPLPERMIAAIGDAQGNDAISEALVKAKLTEKPASAIYYLQTNASLRNAVSANGGNVDRLAQSLANGEGGDGGDAGGSPGGGND